MNGRARVNWDQYAIVLATAASARSQDPYTQVGAVVMRPDHSVAGVGYNGPPSGVEVDWSDRDGRRSKMVHAEANALRYVRPGEVSFLAATLMPCIECLKTAASYGITRIVYGQSYTNTAVYDTSETERVASEFGVELSLIPNLVVALTIESNV